MLDKDLHFLTYIESERARFQSQENLARKMITLQQQQGKVISYDEHLLATEKDLAQQYETGRQELITEQHELEKSIAEQTALIAQQNEQYQQLTLREQQEIEAQRAKNQAQKSALEQQLRDVETAYHDKKNAANTGKTQLENELHTGKAALTEQQALLAKNQQELLTAKEQLTAAEAVLAGLVAKVKSTQAQYQTLTDARNLAEQTLLVQYKEADQQSGLTAGAEEYNALQEKLRQADVAVKTQANLLAAAEGERENIKSQQIAKAAAHYQHLCELQRQAEKAVIDHTAAEQARLDQQAGVTATRQQEKAQQGAAAAARLQQITDQNDLAAFITEEQQRLATLGAQEEAWLLEQQKAKEQAEVIHQELLAAQQRGAQAVSNHMTERQKALAEQAVEERQFEENQQQRLEGLQAELMRLKEVQRVARQALEQFETSFQQSTLAKTSQDEAGLALQQQKIEEYNQQKKALDDRQQGEEQAVVKQQQKVAQLSLDYDRLLLQARLQEQQIEKLTKRCHECDHEIKKLEEQEAILDNFFIQERAQIIAKLQQIANEDEQQQKNLASGLAANKQLLEKQRAEAKRTLESRQGKFLLAQSQLAFRVNQQLLRSVHYKALRSRLVEERQQAENIALQQQRIAEQAKEEYTRLTKTAIAEKQRLELALTVEELALLEAEAAATPVPPPAVAAIEAAIVATAEPVVMATAPAPDLATDEEKLSDLRREVQALREKDQAKAPADDMPLSASPAATAVPAAKPVILELVEEGVVPNQVRAAPSEKSAAEQAAIEKILSQREEFTKILKDKRAKAQAQAKSEADKEAYKAIVEKIAAQRAATPQSLSTEELEDVKAYRQFVAQIAARKAGQKGDAHPGHVEPLQPLVLDEIDNNDTQVAAEESAASTRKKRPASKPVDVDALARVVASNMSILEEVNTDIATYKALAEQSTQQHQQAVGAPKIAIPDKAHAPTMVQSVVAGKAMQETKASTTTTQVQPTVMMTKQPPKAEATVSPQLEDHRFIEDRKKAILVETSPFSNVLLYGVILFFVIGIIWAKLATVDEITSATGKVVPSAQVQVIQNLEGGIVSKILVNEGDNVKKGQVLLMIDDTRFAADYREAQNKYLALLGDVARLTAQAKGADKVDFPPIILQQAPDVVVNETKSFQSLKEQLDTNVSHLQASYDLAKKEYDITKPLVNQGLMSQLDLIRIERDINDLQGKVSAAKDEYRANSFKELNIKQAELDALAASITTAKDRMTRTTVRTPVTGTVKKINVATVGGVLQPGSDIMEIVPTEDTLLIEARVKPSDIAFIRPDERAVVKFTAYEFAIYGGLDGTVEYISADTITDPDDPKKESFYKILVRTQKNYLFKNNKRYYIIPGMTTNVDIMTGKKTVLDYLLKPLFKAKEQALRER